MPTAQQLGRLEDVCYFEGGRPQKLGQGSFGTVFKGRSRRDNRSVAVKIIEKTKLQQHKLKPSIVEQECEMMRECAGRESFVQLFDYVETNHTFCLILECCDGGNVQDGAMLVDGTLGELQVRTLMRQMLESIVYLHAKTICHRDVKPHNFFLVGNISQASVQVKLGDFGTALRLPAGKLLIDQVGTPAFMAPEIHLLPNKSRGYDHKVDVWAIGVCMIFLLANEYPFIDGQGRLLRERIIRGGVPLWEPNSFDNLFQGFQEAVGMTKKRPSKSACDLTRHLLAPCSRDRPASLEALQHEWFSRPVTVDNDADSLPLLDMKDFEVLDLGWMADVVDHIANEVHQVVAPPELQHQHGLVPSRPLGQRGAPPLGAFPPAPFSVEEQRRRGSSCSRCARLATSTNFVCPCCGMSHCFECTRDALAACPRCPGCGDSDRVPAAVTQHIAANEAWASAEKFGVAIQRGLSDITNMFLDGPNGMDKKSYPAELSRGDHHVISDDRRCNPYQQAPMPPPMASHTNMARSKYSCCMCLREASMIDHECPCCGVLVCVSCITHRLPKHNLRCPSCNDSHKNTENMVRLLNVHEARTSIGNIWSSIMGSFSSEGHHNGHMPNDIRLVPSRRYTN